MAEEEGSVSTPQSARTGTGNRAWIHSTAKRSPDYYAMNAELRRIIRDEVKGLSDFEREVIETEER